MGRLADKLAGRFIVIDGPDGAGKTTQLARLREHLEALGLQVRCFIDPGSTRIGNKIRAILLDRDNGQMARMCETFLFMASRAQLVAECVRPALQECNVVLCDRFVSATVAYQGALGVDRRVILSLSEAAIEGLWPDLTIILDIPVEEGMRRLGVVRRRLKREGEIGERQLPLFGDRMESRASDYHQEVRRLFGTLQPDYPGSVRYVKATGTAQVVFDGLLAAIEAEFVADEPVDAP